MKIDDILQMSAADAVKNWDDILTVLGDMTKNDVAANEALAAAFIEGLTGKK